MPAAGRSRRESARWLTEYPEALTVEALKTTGAEDVRWDLTDLFISPDDPKIEAALKRELERAQAFEARYKAKVAELEPTAFAAMMRELGEYEESAAKPEVYAYMLHSQDTQDHAAGRLLARVREAGGERGSHRGVARRHPHSRLHLQRHPPGEGDRRPSAPLPVLDQLAQPGERDVRCGRAGARRRRDRSLRRVRSLLPRQTQAAQRGRSPRVGPLRAGQRRDARPELGRREG